LACNPYEFGHLLFQEFISCSQIFNSPNNMPYRICASGDTLVFHAYQMYSHWFQNSKITTTFWQVQAAIISQLRLVCLLSIIINTIHPDHNDCSVKTFSSNLKSSGWILSYSDVHYLDLGNMPHHHSQQGQQVLQHLP
jgi:hypothetical protein